MISWSNLAGVWLLLPILTAYILVILLTRFKFNISSLLAGASFKYLANYQTNLKIKLFLWLGILIALLIAFLGPQWGQSVQPVAQSGRNIVIALDVSKSMLAQDLKPNRLEFAKTKIKKLVGLLGGERVGLILFAGDAIVMCPLTRDQDLLLTFLDEVDQNTVSSGTTNLTKPINMATHMLTSTSTNATNLLAIFTDGEDFSQGLSQAGQAAQQAGVHIFTFGMASLHGAPIPEFDAQGQAIGFIKNAQGETVISRLNQALLQTIAQQGSGQSVIVSTQNDDDLAQMLSWVNQFEQNNFGEKQLVLKDPKYYYFVILALIGLLVEWIL